MNYFEYWERKTGKSRPLPQLDTVEFPEIYVTEHQLPEHDEEPVEADTDAA